MQIPATSRVPSTESRAATTFVCRGSCVRQLPNEGVGLIITIFRIIIITIIIVIRIIPFYQYCYYHRYYYCSY